MAEGRERSFDNATAKYLAGLGQEGLAQVASQMEEPDLGAMDEEVEAGRLAVQAEVDRRVINSLPKQTVGPSYARLPMAHNAKGAPNAYNPDGTLKTPPMAASSRRFTESKTPILASEEPEGEPKKVVIMSGREIVVEGFQDDERSNPYRNRS